MTSGRSAQTGPQQDGVAAAFIHAYLPDVIGGLHGFDRLRLAGLRHTPCHPEVMQYYLRRSGVPWKDFKAFATGLTDRIRQRAVQPITRSCAWAANKSCVSWAVRAARTLATRSKPTGGAAPDPAARRANTEQLIAFAQ